MTITASGDARGPEGARVVTTILRATKPGHGSLLLRRRSGAADPLDCELVLSEGRGADAIVFGPFDECEAIALWRDLSDQTGALPGLEGQDGTLHWPFRQLGRIRLGEGDGRRRHRTAPGRPRFLLRRKIGRLPRRPLVYRESEIAAGRE